MMHKQATPRAIDPCRRFFLTLSRIALLPAGAPASGGLLGGVQLGDLQAVVREVERVELAMKQAAATAAPTDPAVGTTSSPVVLPSLAVAEEEEEEEEAAAAAGEQLPAVAPARELQAALRQGSGSDGSPPSITSRLNAAHIQRYVAELRSGGAGLDFGQFLALVESQTTLLLAKRMRCARLAVLAGTAAFALGGLGYTVVATLGGDWTTTSGTVFTGNTAMLVVYLLFAMWLVDLFGLIVFFRYAGKAISAVLKPGAELSRLRRASAHITAALITTINLFFLWLGVLALQTIASPWDKMVMCAFMASMCHTLHVGARALGLAIEASAGLAGADHW